MNKAIKFGSIAAAVIATGAIVSTAVFAWGDNSGGRGTHTIKQIESNILGDKIVFNTIKDTSNSKIPVTDERNFVGARDKATGNNGPKNQWYGNEITVEEGKTYIVRLYVHNNNPKGEKAVAKDVTTSFSLPTVASTQQRVDGYINSSNATPSKYWDSVVFKSKDNRKFYLDYIEGSALLENNGIGKNGGVRLSDEVVTKGTKIGYNALDGNVPGCYQYDNYITIEVKPVFESSSIEKTVRKADTKDKFVNEINAKIGDTVEYQIKYVNNNNSEMRDVTIRDSLPKGMEYVKGSTKLYNANHKNGAVVKEDTITTNGINIGHYGVGANAFVRFKAIVKEEDLSCGTNRVINWAKATNRVGVSTNVNAFAVQDDANVYVEKTCKPNPEKPTPEKPTPEKPNPEKPTPGKPTPENPSKKPEKIPEAGAANIVVGVIGIGGTITATGYYLASRKQLR